LKQAQVSHCECTEAVPFSHRKKWLLLKKAIAVEKWRERFWCAYFFS
jgi:hypothetical protein